jgi:hypothetical protein
LRGVEEVVLNKVIPSIGSRYGNKFMEMVKWMVEFEEEKRPDFVQLEQMFCRYLSMKNYGVSGVCNEKIVNFENTVIMPNTTNLGKSNSPLNEGKYESN